MCKELKRLEQEILYDNCDSSILLLEKDNLEKAFQTRDITKIILLNNFYREKSYELKETFNDSFKILNRILYKLRESFKSEPVNASDEITYKLIKDSRKNFLKDVQKLFQQYVDANERIVESYKFLESISYNLLGALD